jgi:transposase
MSQIHVVGLDLAKQVFQVHAITSEGAVVVRRQLRRSQVLTFFSELPSCLVGMEACGGAHFWAREIMALGHEVRLMPPSYVKPYVKRGKTDAGDAEAICEAVSRPTMRFVAVKTAEQQAAAMVLKTRDLLVRQRNQSINALRAHLSELGIVSGTGVSRVAGLIGIVRDHEDARVPLVARQALTDLADHIEALNERLHRLDREIVVQARQDADLRRLTEVPGIGPISAASLKALVPDPSGFVSGRHFAAWLGLTPRAHSTGGKERLGRISKMGNPTMRTLLILGATTVLRHARNVGKASPWLQAILSRRPAKVAAVALANKMARIVWALLTKGSHYRDPGLAASGAVGA